MDLLRINSYLLAALTAAIVTGCQTSSSKDKELTLIELHIEASPEDSEHTETITVNRAAPVKLTVHKESFLDTRYLTNATLIEAQSLYSIQLDFDKQGLWRLESATSLYTGKRVAVLALFPEKRWLAAPLPIRRISNGRLTFTPDCTREEADRIVKGLNRTVAKLNK
jgi:hypothetical protein